MSKRKYQVGDRVRLTESGAGALLSCRWTDTTGIATGVSGTVTSVGNYYYIVRLDCEAATNGVGANGWVVTENDIERLVDSEPTVTSTIDVIRSLIATCDRHELDRVIEAAIFIERRFGTAMAVEYMRGAAEATKEAL